MRWNLLPAVPAALLMMSLTGCQDGVALARVGAAFLQANGHLAACRDWYEAVRAQFAKG